MVLALLTAAAVPAGSSAADSVAYQLNPAHSGSAQDETLRPPLKMAWAVPFGQASYPLIAGGRVFATSERWLTALDLKTGALLWEASLGGYGRWSGAAYDADRVFAMNGDGLMRAFSAADGRELWSYQGLRAGTPPVADGGTVYFGDGAGRVTALRESDGSVLWQRTLRVDGDRSSPALDAGRAYVTHACRSFWGLDRATGATDWAFPPPRCLADAGGTPALHRGRLYVNDPGERDGVVVDAASGTLVDTFAPGSTPALSGHVGVFANGLVGNRLWEKTLEARDLDTGKRLWSFEGDGQLMPSPIIVNDIVYVGSWTGKLLALALEDGRIVWQDDIAHEFPGADEHNMTGGLYGLGAGEGSLVAGVGGTNTGSFLVAYRAGAAPVVRTDRPTDVKQHSAVLNATVNPCGSPVHVSFQADMRAIPDDTYRIEIVPEDADLPADHKPHRVSVRLDDVERVAGQGWHYRAVVEYGTRGAARFAPAEQMMPPSAPGQVAVPDIALAGEPTIGEEKVFIPARLDAHGGPMSAWLEYGETTDYMYFTREGGWIAAGETFPDPAKFEIYHWRLKPNTVYHYRIGAAGPGGKVYSDDATFVTPGGSESPQESPANSRPVAPEDPDACAATVEEEPEAEERTPTPVPSATPPRPVQTGSLAEPTAGTPPALTAPPPSPPARARRASPRTCAPTRAKRMRTGRIRAVGVSCRSARRIARAAVLRRPAPAWRCAKVARGKLRVCRRGSRTVQFRLRRAR